MGYRNVGHYPGGMHEWMELGCPIETGGDSRAIGSRVGNDVGGTVASTQAGPHTERRRAPGLRFHQGVSALRLRRGAIVAGIRTRSLSWIERLASLPYSTLIDSWLAMVVGLGVVYWAMSVAGLGTLRDAGAPIAHTWRGLLASLYFSVVTATSVGFGDVVPTGFLRLIAVLEGAAGLLLFGCIVSKLASRHQEDVLEQTHQIAFEDRLDRVRTNLHLVLSELQTVAESWSAAQHTPERMLARLEGAAMMLQSELRTIHALLYRTSQTPEEAVLEGL